MQVELISQLGTGHKRLVYFTLCKGVISVELQVLKYPDAEDAQDAQDKDATSERSGRKNVFADVRDRRE